MKEKVYFYASTVEDLKEIKSGSMVFPNLTGCIMQKAYELMSEKGIAPKKGILTEAESGKKENLLVERYDNQFECLDCGLNIYYIPQNEVEVKKNKTTTNTKCFKSLKIDNLHEYLKEKDNVKLINNDDLETKDWINIPFNNIDIILIYFIDVAKESDSKKRKEMISSLQKLLPENKYYIKRLAKIMAKMKPEDFISFISGNKVEVVEDTIIKEKVFSMKNIFNFNK